MNHQRAYFQLKIFFTVLLKKKSHLHLEWPEGERINSKIQFVGELALSASFCSIIISAQVVEGRGRTEGRSPECTVNTRCQESLCAAGDETGGARWLDSQCRSGNICENLSWLVQLLLECRCRNPCKSVARTVSVARPYHTTLSQFR